MNLPTFRLTQRDVLVTAVAALVGVLVLVLYGAGLLNKLELQSVDERFSVRGIESAGTDIVIVAIDQETLDTLGKAPPLPRSYFAEVLDRVRAGSPQIIAIDREFIGKREPAEDAALLAAIARDGPVLLGTHEGKRGAITVPADVPGAPGAVVASLGIDPAPDGVLRRMMYAPVDLEVPTLAVRAAEMFSGQPVDADDFPDNHAWVDFRGPPGSFAHYPFADVMAGTIESDKFTDKAVLIGFTDPVDDVFATSISSNPMPGVEFHANAMWTILAGFPLKSAGGAANVALILALIAIPAAIASRKSGLFTFIASVALAITYLGFAQLAFNAGWIVVVVYPLIGLAIATAGVIAVDAYIERRQRAALEAALGDLLPPQKPPAFFISYRRSQNAWHAGDIRRELVRRYGDASVFTDTSSIEYGEAFPDRIASAIRGCSVMLVLIGQHWLDPINGTRRIDHPNDWVRKEIEAGLLRQEAVVVPVLLDGAVMPAEDDLPASVKRLATLHAVTLVGGDDLATGIDILLHSVERGRQRVAESDGAAAN